MVLPWILPVTPICARRRSGSFAGFRLVLTGKAVSKGRRRRTAEGVEVSEPDAGGDIVVCMSQLNLSARACHRILKLARAIADLAGSEEIQSVHRAALTVCFAVVQSNRGFILTGESLMLY